MAQRFFARGRIVAFADDVALALANAPRQLPGVARAFSKWSRATGLRLKASKCVFLPLEDLEGYDTLRNIIDSCLEFAGAQICRSARHLALTLANISGRQ